ncbi:MAG: exosortase/archaeosortase family protein [Nibricoccus sp.]
MSIRPDTSSGSPPADSFPATRLGKIGWLNFALAAALALGAALFLLPQWRHNPDLPHGWFMPLVFILLIHEARTRGEMRFLTSGPWHLAAVSLCVVCGVGLLALGALYMAVLEWTHALVVLMMIGALCAFFCAIWLTCADERVRQLPFNWPAAAAIFLWLLSMPMPPGTYATLTQSLQGFVTSTVLNLLHLCGIAAVKQGNILQLTDVTVGVEEACSGVRSLLSCVYTGLFLSATLVRRVWPRVAIVALAGPLAILMNVVRSFILTLLAHNGVAITGLWHDVTGYGVIGVTAALLAGLALWLDRRGSAVSEKPRQGASDIKARPVATTALWPQRIVVGGIFLAAVVIGILLLNLRPATTAGRAAPNLSALLPSDYAGWSAHPDQELYRFTSQLQTTFLAQTTYQRPNPAGGEIQELSVYLAYWPAGTAPVSVVATHTPDACFPGAGWVIERQVKDSVETTARKEDADGFLANNPFAKAEKRVFGLQGYTRYVWYWHIYDGRVIHVSDVRSPKQLLLLAWRYGFHREGEQLFVRVVSSQPLEKIAHEPILQEIFTRLAPFGL